MPAKHRTAKSSKQRASTQRTAASRSAQKPRQSKTSDKSTSRPKGASRSYTQATIRKLFGLCSNQCAYPGCSNPIIVGALPPSDAEIVGHICHIYAASNNGPRGKQRLTNTARNSFSNLILMCGHHHPVIDKQHAAYPARLLIEWKRKHEAKATSGTLEAIAREADIGKHDFLAGLSDEQIEKSLSKIRRARFLAGSPTAEDARRLATQVENRELSSGSLAVRAKALAWCSRLLSLSEPEDVSTRLLAASRRLHPTPEADIAGAFILSRKDESRALARLTTIGSPQALSAALRIHANSQGASKTLLWIKASGLTIDRFDCEGKLLLLLSMHENGDWDAARSLASDLSEADFGECPVLLHISATSRLMMAVPAELRASISKQPPLSVDDFPLFSTPQALVERRLARSEFSRAAAFALEIGNREARNTALDYALWLGLRDPQGHDSAMIELRDGMSNPDRIFRCVNFAIHFGLKVDLEAIEVRLDQAIALSKEGTADEAYARLALAFASRSPRDLASYLERHRDFLRLHLNDSFVTCLEIEALARAGSLSAARQRLKEAKARGLSSQDLSVVKRILSEVSGSDPVSERRLAYESSRSVADLNRLVDALEGARLWPDLLPFAQELFSVTPTIEAYETLVRCLNNLGRFDELRVSLESNPELVDQSENVRLVWAWTLFREGRFGEAQVQREALQRQNGPNARRLRVSIAIATGGWDDLLGFCNETWLGRDTFAPSELLQTAHLSIAVNGPHSYELVSAATQRAPEDATTLAGAYFLAVRAGWDKSQEVAGWLRRAAELSGDSGPPQRMSLQELVDRKPAWDQRAEDVIDRLRKGEIPAFVAGQALNRSLIELNLATALANLSTRDVRRRSIVFAYSGARQQRTIGPPSTIAIDPSALITLSRLGLLDTVLRNYRVSIPHETLSWLFEEKQTATFHQPSRIADAKDLRRLIDNKSIDVRTLPASGDVRLSREVGADLADMLSLVKGKISAGEKAVVVRSSPLHNVTSVLMEEANIAGYENCLCSCSAIVTKLRLTGALTETEERTARDYLTLHERPWQGERALEDGTEIYLDDLSISYLQTAGVLRHLGAMKCRAIITHGTELQITHLLELESLGTQVLEHIERIRGALARGIASGTVRVGRILRMEDDAEASRSHPTFGVMGLVSTADAAVVDDRFINRHEHVTSGLERRPLLSVVDILFLLSNTGAIAELEVFSHLTALRQSGYQLVPLGDSELLHYVRTAVVADGVLMETAELRAIRESLLRARMASIVQLPLEAPFLHTALGTYIKTIKAVWETEAEIADMEARSRYLLDQIDVRKWSSSAIPGAESALFTTGFAAHALQLASPPLNAEKSIKDSYYRWISTEFLDPLKRYHPGIYRWVVDQSVQLTLSGVEKYSGEFGVKP